MRVGSVLVRALGAVGSVFEVVRGLQPSAIKEVGFTAHLRSSPGRRLERAKVCLSVKGVICIACDFPRQNGCRNVEERFIGR